MAEFYTSRLNIIFANDKRQEHGWEQGYIGLIELYTMDSTEKTVMSVVWLVKIATYLMGQWY